MSQAPRKIYSKKQPPPINPGQHDLLAAATNQAPATVRKQYTRNKYDYYIQDGQYDIDGIKNNSAKLFQVKKRGGNKAKTVKKATKDNLNSPETKEEINQYLDENIGDLSTLAIDELWRRNELEKLLMAQIKRRVAENQLIDADVVKRESFADALLVREQLESIPDRCAPLVAASSDQFECREILAKEINYILYGLSDAYKVS